MAGPDMGAERRTSADLVFDTLYDRIVTLNVMPGTKMSEADVADQFGVSRQPVRDAFNRLGKMGLLLIQPQKATIVQNFSLSAIATARFERLALEVELVKRATAEWSDKWRAAFLENLDDQERAVAENDSRSFNRLDIEFHRLIADAANQPQTFETVNEKKAIVERICLLSLKLPDEMKELVADHRAIFAAISRGDAEGAEQQLRSHLSRIDKTIANVRANHAEFFDA